MKKSLSDSILRHLLDESYERHNMWHREYTPDVVEHWIRFFWRSLEVLRDAGDLDAVAVYADLSGAIARLPDTHRAVVTMLIEDKSLTDISAELRINSTHRAKQAFRAISAMLSGRPVQTSGVVG